MIPFTKAHANGNDFLILDEADAHGDHAHLARTLCARSTGIGADGIEFLSRSEVRSDPANPSLRLFNSDGSEAELSGNGTRCVAAVLAHTEGLSAVSFQTAAGLRTCRVVKQDGPIFEIVTDMGVPTVTPRTITLPDIRDVDGAAVDVGNPHFVLFVRSPDFAAHGMSWQQLGARISTSPLFPHGTNVEFVHLRSPDEIEFRIYERGCGPTTSSGTGTCASSAAAIVLRDASRTLRAFAEGGMQTVEWPEPTEPMRLTGPAEIICSGRAVA